jgi:hypothetical protein
VQIGHSADVIVGLSEKDARNGDGESVLLPGERGFVETLQ